MENPLEPQISGARKIEKFALVFVVTFHGPIWSRTKTLTWSPMDAPCPSTVCHKFSFSTCRQLCAHTKAFFSTSLVPSTWYDICATLWPAVKILRTMLLQWFLRDPRCIARCIRFLALFFQDSSAQHVETLFDEQPKQHLSLFCQLLPHSECLDSMRSCLLIGL